MKWLGKHPVFSDLLIDNVLIQTSSSGGEYDLTLPINDGASGQVLSTDGSGVLSWVANGVAVPNALTIGTGVDLASGNTSWDGSAAETLNLDLTEVIDTDGADRVLTSNGDGTLSAESSLTYNNQQKLVHAVTPSGNFIGYEQTITTAAGWASGSNTGTGIDIVFNKDENTAAANTYTGLHNDINDTATNNATLTQLVGINNEIDFANDAASGNLMAWGVINNINNGDSQFGIKNELSGGGTPETTYGIYQTVDDGGHDLYFLSSDTTTVDYFSLKTGASGATTLTTVDGGGIAADLTFNVDGNIVLNADGGFIDFKDDSANLARFTTDGLSFQNNTGAGIKFEGSTDNANQTTLSVIDPTATRTINLPDASGTVSLSDTTYSAGDGLDLSGTTFSTDLKSNGGLVIESTELAVDLGASSITGTLAVGDGGTGSATPEIVSTGNFILKQTKVTMNPTACNNLYASPTTLVAAQGADTLIMPVDVVILVDYNSAQNVNCDLIVGYNGTTSYTYAIRYVRRFMYGVSTDMTMHLVPYLGNAAASLTGGVDVPLTISTSAAITAGSMTSITAYTSYYVIDNS